jgi:hypothetical protein
MLDRDLRNLVLRKRTTAEELHRWTWPKEEAVHSSLLSPDGRLLATLTSREANPRHDGRLQLWRTDSGAEISLALEPDEAVVDVVFGPDGRSLAAVTRRDTVHLIETATGRRRARFLGHEGPRLGFRYLRDSPRLNYRHYTGRDSRSLAFSGDGRLLAAANIDSVHGTVLLWDVRRAAGAIQGEPTADEIEALWADLAAPDAECAYRAQQRLAASKQGVALFQARMTPAAAAAAQRVRRLIADLDAEEFAVRERAAQELERLGEAAAPALRRTLADDPSPETGQRIRRLLDGVTNGPLPAEILRGVRVTEVLEQIDDEEARQLLARLAEGASEARLTVEARASLDRLLSQPRR